MRIRSLFLLALVVLSVPANAEENTDPTRARFVMDDVANFWAALDAISAEATAADSAAAISEYYLEPASDGLEEFVRLRIGTATALAATVGSHAKYYAAIRNNTMSVGKRVPEIRAALAKFQELYADAVFPDVYFLVGRLNSVGTRSEIGLSIGTELFAMDDSTPLGELSDWERSVVRSMDSLPLVVVHELMHFQQNYRGERRTLLAKSIREGAADFLTELVAGAHTNGHVHEWASSREADLWKEFAPGMLEEEWSAWLFNGNRSGDRPADLGYYVGYRIVQAYYENTTDKTKALADVLTIEDFEDFLAKSGYAARFSD